MDYLFKAFICKLVVEAVFYIAKAWYKCYKAKKSLVRKHQTSNLYKGK